MNLVKPRFIVAEEGTAQMRAIRPPPRGAKQGFVGLLCLGLFVIGARAAELAKATVHFHAGVGGVNVSAEDGQPLLAGSEVRLGILPDNFNFAQLAGRASEVGKQWQSIGATSVRSLFGESGRFAAEANSVDRSLAGRKLYLWILKTSDGLPARDDYANVVAHALVSSAQPNWRVPSADALPPSNLALLALTEADAVFVGVRSTNTLAVALVTTANQGVNYDDWVAVVIGNGDRSSAGDNDADGLVNLLEFMLGTDPTRPNTFQPNLERIYFEGKTYLQMSFFAANDRVGAVLAVEGSSDRISWSAISNLKLTDQHNGKNFVVARDGVAVEDAIGQARFLRITVSR